MLAWSLLLLSIKIVSKSIKPFQRFIFEIKKNLRNDLYHKWLKYVNHNYVLHWTNMNMFFRLTITLCIIDTLPKLIWFTIFQSFNTNNEFQFLSYNVCIIYLNTHFFYSLNLFSPNESKISFSKTISN